VFESNSSVLTVFGHIRPNIHSMLGDEVLSSVFGLVHVEDKLDAATFGQRRDIKIEGTARKHHHLAVIDSLEIGLDGEFGLVKLLLT
jgi:hypothetical protein